MPGLRVSGLFGLLALLVQVATLDLIVHEVHATDVPTIVAAEGLAPDSPDSPAPQSVDLESPEPAVGRTEPDQTALIVPVAHGSLQFAFDLYAELRETEGNLFLSPHSVAVALAMTMAGARGDTRAQMERVLHVEGDSVAAGFHALQDELSHRSEAGPVLSIGNRLWGDAGIEWKAPFLEVCQTHYDGAFEAVDFSGNPEEARLRINSWAADVTQDTIKEPMVPGSVDPQTTLVLASAIYFKGGWLQPFDEKNTSEGTFHLAGEATVDVPFMRKASHFAYFETETYQAVELPYVGEQLTMVALVPKTTLAELEGLLGTETWADILTGLVPRSVNVVIPRFKLDAEFSVDDALGNLGMPLAFQSVADFSAMCDRGVFIDKVRQKSFIEVNEQGTEAAAATSVFLAYSMPSFRADRPFVFAIRDRGTGTVLFLGRVADPSG